MKDMDDKIALEKSELSDEVKERITEKDALLMKLKSFEAEIATLNQEKMKVWKEVREAYHVLKAICPHEWKREPYPYAPLYCSICGYEKP